MSIKAFKSHLTVTNKQNKEYKEYLQVCKEDGLDYYQASKTVMEYLNPGDKLTIKDYAEINRLRSWYNKDDSER